MADKQSPNDEDPTGEDAARSDDPRHISTAQGMPEEGPAGASPVDGRDLGPQADHPNLQPSTRQELAKSRQRARKWLPWNHPDKSSE